MAVLHRFPILSFIVLTFIISHLINPVFVELVSILFHTEWLSFPMGRSLLTQYGGSIAALFLVWKLYGVRGIKSTLSYSKPKKGDAIWFLVSILLPLLMILLSYCLAGIRVAELLGILAQHWQHYLLTIGVFLITAGFAEEYGWRGFMLPQLLQTTSPLTATLLVYLVSGVWHFPALLAGWKNEPLLPWLILTVPIAVIHSWLFFKAKGNLLVPILFHACFDAQYAFYSQYIANDRLNNPGFHQGWTYIISYCILGLLIVIFTKAKLGFDPDNFSPSAYFGIKTSTQL